MKWSVRAEKVVLEGMNEVRTEVVVTGGSRLELILAHQLIGLSSMTCEACWIANLLNQSEINGN